MTDIKLTRSLCLTMKATAKCIYLVLTCQMACLLVKSLPEGSEQASKCCLPGQAVCWQASQTCRNCHMSRPNSVCKTYRRHVDLHMMYRPACAATFHTLCCRAPDQRPWGRKRLPAAKPMMHQQCANGAQSETHHQMVAHQLRNRAHAGFQQLQQWPKPRIKSSELPADRAQHRQSQWPAVLGMFLNAYASAMQPKCLRGAVGNAKQPFPGPSVSAVLRVC